MRSKDLIFAICVIKMEKMSMTDEEWKKKLKPDQYKVLREKGTEMAFTGKFYKTKDRGMYVCAGCGTELFSSDAKFESGTGWPSFDEPKNLEHVKLIEDYSYGMNRIEVVCKKCGGHLGHVFDEGPTKTGKRFCINSSSLDFKKS